MTVLSHIQALKIDDLLKLDPEVGRHLAQRLKVPFIDLDHQLEQVLKTSIRQFFEAEGEARFRDIEAQVLAEVTARPGGMVLSTGGGAVLRRPCQDARRGPGREAGKAYRTAAIGAVPFIPGLCTTACDRGVGGSLRRDR